MAASLYEVSAKQESFTEEYKGWVLALRGLDKTLEQLECYSEVYANLGCTSELLQRTRAMAQGLPEFFLHEDVEISIVEKARPGLSDCATCVRKDRSELRLLLEQLAKSIETLPRAEDIAAAIYSIKEQGNNFISRFGTHLVREQSAISAIR